MRAVHGEAAGGHRRQPGQTLRHPVGVRHRLDGQRRRCRFAGNERDQRAQRRLVGRRTEMDRHLPLAAVALEGGADGVIGIEALAQRAGKLARGRLVTDKAGDGGGHGGHQYFVMAGLVPAISLSGQCAILSEMRGSSPRMTMVGETAGNGYVGPT